MIDKYQENQHLRNLLQRLLEAETGEDAMICHDGGFRYSGDFMSMESDVIELTSILSPDEQRVLQEHGFVETLDEAEAPSVRVTDAGRAFAFKGNDQR